MGIPKVIHYCWFGRNPKNELVQDCIKSWTEYYPDYEITEWNEDNFDVNSIQYTRDAYSDGKWAFVSDYARLKIVYENGGTYLDTDVLMKSRCLDEWTQNDCWLASEMPRFIATGLGFGAKKGNPVIKALMDAYQDYTYPGGTNVSRDTLVLEKALPNWHKSDQTQVVDGVLIVGCRDYGKYASHFYAYSWSDDAQKAKTKIPDMQLSRFEKFAQDFRWNFRQAIRNRNITSFMDTRKGTLLEKVYTFLAYDFIDCGPLYFAKRVVQKLVRYIKEKIS